MIELVVRGYTLDDDRVLAEQLGGESGIVLSPSTTPRLTLHQDLDALIMSPIIAAEQLNILPSREPVPFTLDAATGESTLIYPATVGTAHPTEPHEWRGELEAAWVVGYAAFAPLPMERLEGMGEATFRDSTGDEGIYIIILDAMEAMERNNATGSEPKIRRAGSDDIAVSMAPALLRAYHEYRRRSEAGLYD